MAGRQRRFGYAQCMDGTPSQRWQVVQSRLELSTHEQGPLEGPYLTSTPSWAATAALQRASTPSDLLHLGADDVRRLELCERRALLRAQLRKAASALIYSEHLEAKHGEALFRDACAMGL